VQTLNRGHGRVERRVIAVSSDLAGYLDWPGARQVVRIQRRIVRVRTGEVLREETVYGVTSLDEQRGTAERLLRIVREHWSIENRSHWVRDVTFDEDRCQVRTPNIPQVLATLRNLVIGLLRQLGERTVADARRTCSADPSVVLRLLRTTTEN
jgi:predicted transposase YbfD/YdcC